MEMQYLLLWLYVFSHTSCVWDESNMIFIMFHTGDLKGLYPSQRWLSQNTYNTLIKIILVVWGCGVCVCIRYVHEGGYPSRSKEGIRFPGARVMVNCELPALCIRNQTPVLFKNRKHWVISLGRTYNLKCFEPKYKNSIWRKFLMLSFWTSLSRI